ncbi:unnamed protein product [Peronospora destructor]|uniref:Chromo domain-containing protein n=1 Tax=Peronospora destructor TaxID=86335 RepID=A0AAV0T2E9_9STRA|nr:unnamed protein product [Peronospora destructor]
MRMSEELEALLAASSDEDVVMEGETEWQPTDEEVEVVAVVAPVEQAEAQAAGGRTRKSRKSAEFASAKIACQLVPTRGTTRKRRTMAITESNDSSEESFDEMCEAKRLVKREEQEGVHWYLVKWVDAEPGEKYSCVPAVALAGAATWKAALYRYYDEVLCEEPDLTIQPWLRRDVEAVRTVMKLQGGAFEMTEAHIEEFEQRETMRRVAQGGLRTEQPNAYGVGGDKPGPAGILLAVGMKPGIYLVATLDDLYRGRCFVTEVGANKMALAYEDGIEMGLGEYKYAEKSAGYGATGPEASEAAEAGEAATPKAHEDDHREEDGNA